MSKEYLHPLAELVAQMFAPDDEGSELLSVEICR